MSKLEELKAKAEQQRKDNQIWHELAALMKADAKKENSHEA